MYSVQLATLVVGSVQCTVGRALVVGSVRCTVGRALAVGSELSFQIVVFITTGVYNKSLSLNLKLSSLLLIIKMYTNNWLATLLYNVIYFIYNII